MRKKKAISKVEWIIVIIIFCTLGWVCFKIGSSYTEIIKANWEISLPNGYKEIYEKDSGASFLGDGQRYHIFRYKDIEAVNECIEWYVGTNVVVKTEVEEVLEGLDVPEDMWPNLTTEYKYYSKLKLDSSRLYLIFNEELKELYIVEDIH